MVGLQAQWPDELVHGYQVKNDIFLYPDRRDIEDHLDTVCGPFNWSASYRIVDPEARAVECLLTLYAVTKADVGYPNNPIGATSTNKQGVEYRIDSDEPLKEAYTDALRRAAFSWGIARDLCRKQQDAKEAELVQRKRRARHGATSRREHQQQRQEPAAQAAPQPPPSGDPATDGISENQMQTIEKLCRIMGEPIPSLDGMTAKEAGDCISDLSKEYNRRRQEARRSA